MAVADANAEDTPPPPAKASRIAWYQWPVLLSIDMIGPFSTDAYIPNMPQMRQDFGCAVALATLTLQLNWITNALANSACGSLSDRYGRRRTAALFLAVYVAGAAVCVSGGAERRRRGASVEELSCSARVATRPISLGARREEAGHPRRASQRS